MILHISLNTLQLSIRLSWQIFKVAEFLHREVGPSTGMTRPHSAEAPLAETEGARACPGDLRAEVISTASTEGESNAPSVASECWKGLSQRHAARNVVTLWRMSRCWSIAGQSALAVPSLAQQARLSNTSCFGGLRFSKLVCERTMYWLPTVN